VRILGQFWCVSENRVEPAQPEILEKNRVETAQPQFLKSLSSWAGLTRWNTSKVNSVWTFPKKTPELIVLLDSQHVWLKSGHFAGAVNKIDTSDSTYRGMV